MSIADSKKGRGRPKTGIGSAIGLRLYPDIEKALDGWIKSQPKPRPSKPDAIRLALRDWLTDHGFLKPPPLDPAELTDEIADLDAKAAALKHDGSKSPANALKTMKRAVVKNEATKLRNKLAKAKSAKGNA